MTATHIRPFPGLHHAVITTNEGINPVSTTITRLADVNDDAIESTTGLAAVATKAPASDLIEADAPGDYVGRKMSGPFARVSEATLSQGGKTVRIEFANGESWSPRAGTDVWVLVPTGDEPETPADPTGGATPAVPEPPTHLGTLEALEGKRARVQRVGDDPIEGKVKQASDGKDGGRRFKIGSRIVSVRDVVGVEAIEAETPPAPAPDPTPGPTDPNPAPTPNPNPTPTGELTPEQAAEQLPAVIGQYVHAHASTEPLAPMAGDPFVQDGRLYIQLEGRGGAARGNDVTFTPTGLKPFLVAGGNGLGAAKKSIIQKALTALGFERAPFPYAHPDRGSTAASYYSRTIEGFGVDLSDVEPRVPKRRERRDTGGGGSISDVEIIPTNPEGDEADTARLTELWSAYNAARLALQRAKRDKRDEALTTVRAAQAELLAHRKMMVAKLAAAEATA